jgi:hypothetical protein
MFTTVNATPTPTCRTTEFVAILETWKRRARDEHGSVPPSRGAPEIHGRPAAVTKEERAIVCAACGHGITHRQARAEIAGAHVHTFKNPSAIDYTIGCFREAHGCQPFGEHSTVWTWFPGYAWRVALCARCGAHLGWSFHGDASVFWGLILERLHDNDN